MKQSTLGSANDGFRYELTLDDESGLLSIVLQVRIGDEWRDTPQRMGIELRDARLLVAAIGRLTA